MDNLGSELTKKSKLTTVLKTELSVKPQLFRQIWLQKKIRIDNLGSELTQKNKVDHCTEN